MGCIMRSETQMQADRFSSSGIINFRLPDNWGIGITGLAKGGG